MKYLIFVSCFFAIACSRTEIPFGTDEECETDYTYTNDIAAIVNKSCAYANCHLNNTAPGNFDTYEGLKAYLDDGEFLKRTVSIKNMPPNYAPDNKPKELTADEIMMISCWAENDYPQ